MSFHSEIIEVIKQIPYGKVTTYGRIASLAGNPRGARQVARTLHNSSAKENLPWHRVINSKWEISLKPGYGYELQKKLLVDEGVVFNKHEKIDPHLYSWPKT